MPELSSRDQQAKKAVFDKWSKYYDSDHLWHWYFNAGYKKVVFYLIKENVSLGRSLDIGCGTGGLEEIILKNSFKSNTLAIDISEEMVKVARQKIVDQQIEFLVGDFNDLKLQKESFNNIFILNNLHHFTIIKDFFSKIDSLLLKGGHLFLIDPNADGILRKFWTVILDNVFFRHEGDVKYHSFKLVDKILKELKYSIIISKNFYFFSKFCIYRK
ncbi:MAG: class I SAM-dependent methyltransferase [Patescibacteria group bacterium]